MSASCFYHQTWAIGRLRGTNSVQTNLKDTDDVMMQRSHDFGKRPYPANIYLLNVNYKNPRDIFKVNNKNFKTTSLTSFWFFYC